MDNIKKATDPIKQCTAIAAYGQCTNEKEEGYEFCPVHNSLNKRRQEKKRIHSLRLAKWQSQVDDHANDESIKSLRGEIGILRMLLEGTINRCTDDAELLLSSGKISDIVVKLEKLVVSCHKLEQGAAGSMDRAALIQFASQVVTIIGNHINNEEIIDLISKDILKVLT